MERFGNVVSREGRFLPEVVNWSKFRIIFGSLHVSTSINSPFRTPENAVKNDINEEKHTFIIANKFSAPTSNVYSILILKQQFTAISHNTRSNPRHLCMPNANRVLELIDIIAEKSSAFHTMTLERLVTKRGGGASAREFKNYTNQAEIAPPRDCGV